MNLLDLVGSSMGELGFDAPVSVASSADPQVRQFYRLISRLGVDLCRQYDWQRLTTEGLINTVAVSKTVTTVQGSPIITMADTSGLSANYGALGLGIRPFSQIVSVDSATQVTMNMGAQSSGTNPIQFSQVQYPLPSDWGHEIPQTEWDRTNRWPLVGPQSGQSWQSFKSGIVYAGPRIRFRIMGNAITLNPPPPNGSIFAYEYVSKAYVVDATGARKTAFSADTDTVLFDDSLIIVGLKVKFKQEKGLDFSFDLAEFKGLLDQCRAQDQSAPTLSLSPSFGNILMTTANVPDGNWVG